MVKLNNKGFSVVEVVIAIVVLGALVSVGFLVWNRQNTAKPQASTTTSTETSPNNQAKTTVDYTEKDTGFSFKAPADWEKIEGRGLVVRFKAPKADKEGSTSFQANIQVHSEDFTGTLEDYTSKDIADTKVRTQEVSNIVVSQENSSTGNGVAISTYEKSYTLTYDNTNVHCLNVLHVAKGKALDISACTLASKWDTYKQSLMQGLIGYSY